MPDYVEKALAWFGHTPPTQPQNQPHKHTIPTYRATVQYAKNNNTSKSLAKDEKKYIQQVLGTFFSYGHVVDSTMLPALSSIASTQAKPTKATMASIKLFLNYAATHQHVVLTYHASNMVSVIHSNVSYLSKPKARSQADGHFFMSSNTADPANNVAVLNIAQLIKTIMSWAAEAELRALYINAREAVPMQNLLQEMGHPQPPTPTQANNSSDNWVSL
jgi:hypothetical protein